MTIAIRVQGAANSGHRFATSKQQSPKSDWRCTEGHENKGRWTRCLTPGCNEKRPIEREE